MFRLLHSADWQLGARFSQFGGKGVRLREARLEALERTLQLAEKHTVDAFLIAGDLFEDNQVEDALVERVLTLFGTHPQLPIYILPGNHDAASGPDSVWQRKAFLNAPAHVHVLREAGVTDLGAGTFLLASPLHQKLSTTDPSLKLVDLAADLPADAIKIGLTHGALAIEAKHQPNDFPIALNAASRAGLDYLAVGHWHNWLPDTDGGRIVMPGSPEPDRFINDASGHVALVEIPGAGQAPQVKRLRVATLDWREILFDFHAAEASRASLAATLAELTPQAAHTVLRVKLTGTATPTAVAELRAWLDTVLTPFLISQLVDKSRIALSAIEQADLQARHPILAQVLADIDRLETFAGGTVATAESQISNSKSEIAELEADGVAALQLADAQALLGTAKIALTQLTPEFFAQLRQTVFQTLQEVSA
ncbi:metallophosphoesterase family protein [Synoicihabitans lomoniglobus]|uniref:DNA repair exonuclease n=1 Tax=Synoicihabitans lomoniglobus TaxID=2909285 RepID=A0AAF0I222_9BACT|nr:DNA repair exonuclease [Opitutaceae bacterium LMO-M01]WED66207.1 DNA repair exonuclease [Opitutaceae bacterium LMO-M01]